MLTLADIAKKYNVDEDGIRIAAKKYQRDGHTAKESIILAVKQQLEELKNEYTGIVDQLKGKGGTHAEQQ
jgi:hypothetical protein